MDIIINRTSDSMRLENGNHFIEVSLKCPNFQIDGKVYGPGTEIFRATPKNGFKDKLLLEFQPIVIDDRSALLVSLKLQWFPQEEVVRKWATYHISGDSAEIVLNEVILEQIIFGAVKPHFNNTWAKEVFEKPIQSYPAFFRGFFAGLEFPTATTRIDGDVFYISHKPGRKLKSGYTYETKKAVYGICPAGTEMKAFIDYIERKTVRPKGFYFNYCSWWTAPLPYKEGDILGLMKTFKEKLYDKTGRSFNTFSIDLGWSEKYAVWKIDKNLFPQGFENIRKAASKMESNLGLWISPSNCYHPNSFDLDWAKNQGYEVSDMRWHKNVLLKYACIAGKKYRNELLANLVGMIKDYKIKHLKFDGCILECNERDHGHRLGDESWEAIAEGIIEVFNAVREADPNIWMESTCFGWNPSPWWLWHVSSVLGAYGDDAPYGRVPCPIFRESYTTARDYFNLQGVGKIPIAVAGQEVLGIVHQTEDCFMNDAVITIMRGHMFLPFYLNPKFMNDSRWGKLAGLLEWARDNESRLQNTEVLLPESWENGGLPDFSNEGVMPSEPYGYAHWSRDNGFVVIRNPWIKPSEYTITIPLDLLDKNKDSGLHILSLFPEARVYGRNISEGDKVVISLAPYETVLLNIIPGNPQEDIPDYCKHKFIDVAKSESQNSECTGGKNNITLKVTLNISAPSTELLILLQSNGKIEKPDHRIIVNGIEVEPLLTGTEDAWVHSTYPAAEHWLFLQVPLNEGTHDVSLECGPLSDATKTSVWVWSKRRSGNNAGVCANLLPSPDWIYLDAVRLY